MAGRLLDTDICVFWLRKVEIVRHNVESRGCLKNLYISSVTMAELLDGAYRLPESSADQPMTERFIRRVRVLPFDEKAAQRFASIRSQFERFDPAHNLDLMNASIALVRKMTIVTNNVRHYHRFQVSVENWNLPSQ
jgi:tRNA(fMet)-specific endonuclease VapC